MLYYGFDDPENEKPSADVEKVAAFGEHWYDEGVKVGKDIGLRDGITKAVEVVRKFLLDNNSKLSDANIEENLLVDLYSIVPGWGEKGKEREVLKPRRVSITE